jgi:hypothetical protein
MINAITHDDFKNITSVSILDARKVFYPMSYVLNKRDINFDDDQAVNIKLIPEDIKFPGSAKMTDAGQLRDYKVEISINNQSRETELELEALVNKKVILVFFHSYGKIILGCNEMPLNYIFSDENTSKPESDFGFTVICRGDAYFLKVSI